MNRVFRLLNPKAFHECFMQWVRTIATTVEGTNAIDGKTLCNSGDECKKTSPLHIVHAFAVENQLLLGQLATDAKSNEITAIPELLKMLTIQENVITIDAMGCQKEIVHQIREQEGDYVIALKGNQGTLHAEAENFFQQAMDCIPDESECDYTSTIEKNRGRIEERQIYNTLRTVEDAFRFMKSSLGLRPVYHQIERRVDGHLWITIMAYHLIQHCLYQPATERNSLSLEDCAKNHEISNESDHAS